MSYNYFKTYGYHSNFTKFIGDKSLAHRLYFLQLFDHDENGLITVDEFYYTFTRNGYQIDKEELSLIVENVSFNLLLIYL